MTAQLILHERVERSAYHDSRGYLTIGVGRCIDERVGGRLSDREIEFLLNNDLARVEKELDNLIPWWLGLDRIRQRVLFDMCFNMGLTTFIKFKPTMDLVKAGNYEEAAVHMENTPWYKQVGRRGRRLVKMMRSGKDEPY